MSSSKRRHRSKSPSRSWPQDDRSVDSQASAKETPVFDSPESPDTYARPAPVYTRQPPPERERLGEILRNIREDRGENLYAISDLLRIRPNFLAALENSRYDEFPADAYVVGFLRSYAAYLGLDSKAAIEQYRHEMAGRRLKPQLNMPQPISEGRAPTVAILIGATAAALLLYGLWYSLSSSNRMAIDAPPTLPPITQSAPPSLPLPPSEDSTATTPNANGFSNRTPDPTTLSSLSTPVSEEKGALPATEKQSDKTESSLTTGDKTTTAFSVSPSQKLNDKKANTEEPVIIQGETSVSASDSALQTYGSADKKHVVIKANEESWVLITDKRGNTVFDKVLKPGDVYNVPDTKGLRLTTGNGSGVIISLDGVDLPRLGTEAHIVRNISLDLDKLKSRKPTE